MIDVLLRFIRLRSIAKNFQIAFVFGPRIIRTIADDAAAIVLALNPGMEGGPAIADVLFGDINPAGRLPITYPRWANALVPYDHKWSEEQDRAFAPQFEFGFGLGYSTFEYANLSVAPAAASRGAAVDVSVTLRNTGAFPVT